MVEERENHDNSDQDEPLLPNALNPNQNSPLRDENAEGNFIRSKRQR